MKLLGLRHPFFLPLSRRIATCVVTGGWAVFEITLGNAFWATFVGGIALYCAYEFFVSFDPENYKDHNQ